MASDMDHAEEQEMEAEALEAIFDTHFTRTAPPNMWTIDLYPSLAGDEVNHVGCRLVASLPPGYPTSLPELRVQVLQGLAPDEHGVLLQNLAEEEAQSNEGVPSIFAICERLREWLVENNVKGLDDQSMHAQMLRKQLQQTKDRAKPSQLFEAQTVQEVFTEAEVEEIEVRKRREEGTPCNKENFEAWKARFEAEMARTQAILDDADDPKKNRQKKEDRANRLTGYQQFAANMNFEALEAAAEQAEVDGADDGVDDDAEDVDELFQDDVDLDDLDFDSSDEDVVI